MSIKMFSIVFALMLALLPAAYAAEAIPTGGIGLKIALTDYDPSPAKPGKYVTLYLKAENSGGTTLTDATFKLEVEYPFSFKPGESETRYFSSVGAKEQVLLEYDLYVDKDAVEDTYTLYLKLCSDAKCEQYTKTPFTVSVKTGGTPKIEVGLEDADVFSGGTKGTVTLHAVNRGLLNVKFLVLELMQSDQYTIISPPRTYIGELESDDFETVEYTIYVKKNVAMNQSESIKLPVLVEYSDANDKEYYEVNDVYLNVYSKSDMVNFGLVKDRRVLASQAAVVIAGIFLVYLLYRQYKKKSSTS